MHVFVLGFGDYNEWKGKDSLLAWAAAWEEAMAPVEL